VDELRNATEDVKRVYANLIAGKSESVGGLMLYGLMITAEPLSPIEEESLKATSNGSPRSLGIFAIVGIVFEWFLHALA
jgi:hypothetical protein